MIKPDYAKYRAISECIAVQLRQYDSAVEVNGLDEFTLSTDVNVTPRCLTEWQYTKGIGSTKLLAKLSNILCRNLDSTADVDISMVPNLGKAN